MRSSIVAAQVFFALMLFSAGVGDLQSLVGAILCSLTSYVFPVIFYWKLFPGDRDPGVDWAKWDSQFTCLLVIVVAGSLVGVLGFGDRGSCPFVFPRSCHLDPQGHATTDHPHTAAYNTGEAISSYQLFEGSCHASMDDD